MKNLKIALGIILALATFCASAQSGKIEVQWLGNAAMKITTISGKVIVIDPYLINNPKTPPDYKKLEALGKVDLILVTHGHGDHFGDAPALAKLNNAPVWGPAGMNQSVITLGIFRPNWRRAWARAEPSCLLALTSRSRRLTRSIPRN